MSKFNPIVALAALWLAGCADGLGPSVGERQSTDVGLHILRQAGTIPPGTAGDVSFAYASGESASPTPAPLETFDASFWAVRGESRSLRIDYENGERFLELEIPANALLSRPDGTPFATADSVLITVSVDSTLFLVDLEPSGLTFSTDEPAELRIWYAQADPDLNNDGTVDDRDVEIETTMLGLWVQEESGEPWEPNEADHLTTEKWFIGYLAHFSNYAVSW